MYTLTHTHNNKGTLSISKRQKKKNIFKKKVSVAKLQVPGPGYTWYTHITPHRQFFLRNFFFLIT